MVLIKHPIGSRGGGVNDSPFARSPTLAARTLTQMSTNTGGLPGRCPLYLRKRTLIADPKLSAKRQADIPPARLVSEQFISLSD